MLAQHALKRLVDQLFNSSENGSHGSGLDGEFARRGRTSASRHLARELAEMIGTPLRVSFFMNRFATGFINYNGRIQVHRSLLNLFLLDQFPGHNSERPEVAVQGNN